MNSWIPCFSWIPCVFLFFCHLFFDVNGRSIPLSGRGRHPASRAPAGGAADRSAGHLVDMDRYAAGCRYSITCNSIEY